MITRKINSNIGLVTLKSIQSKLFDEASISVSKSFLSKKMKQELNLRWKKSCSMDAYVNQEKNIKYRQQFGLKMVEFVAFKKVIINFDESVLRSTNKQTHRWGWSG